MKKNQAPRSRLRKILNVIYVLALLVLMAGVLIGPVTPGHAPARENATLQLTRTIGLVLSQYARDHGGHFPEGRTSTEVFQKLMDEKYIEDPHIFYASYVMMPGKVEADSNQLKPENVCFDVTCSVDSSFPDGLPLVFLHGYKITYQAGAKIEPLDPPQPMRWTERWNGTYQRPFITVCYKDTSARVFKSDEDGSIPNFIPTDFDPHGKTYQQLMP